MARVAVFGAGSVGSAIAHRLAERSRVDDVLLIDDAPAVAAGKALDIRQSGPISRADTSVDATADPLAAVGAAAIVLADDTVSGFWDGDRGLRLIERLMRAGASGPFVFAGPSQIALLETVVRELHLPADRIVATSASAVESIARSLVAIELGETGAAVTLTGRPPQCVVAWAAATIGGTLVSERVAPHRLLAISQALPRFWPPGPQAVAAATVPAIEALIAGSRRLIPAVTMLDGELGVRGRAGLMPVELGHGRVLRRVPPSLTPQERTEAVSSLLRD